MPRYVRNFFLFAALMVALLLGISPVAAKHIVGGEITYKCLGQPTATTRTYEISIVIYRDPRDSGATFDSYENSVTVFEMTIFRGQNVFERVKIGAENLTVSDVVLDDVNPCFVVPPTLQFERGEYKTVVTLPISEDTYTISYQRCCRNNIITNIIEPENAGATYLVQIPPLAQQSCNSSPRFKQLAPIVICEDELLQFDHSATDPDGDSLVYFLASPYYGGGPRTGEGEVNSPDGVVPNPETPPPYEKVVFVNPFSAQNPIDSDPPMRLDPETGLLSVTPQTTGTYVLCVAVAEYRDGVQIGLVRRDFQFFVAECDPLIYNTIESNAQLGSVEEGFLQFCGLKTLQLKSISTPEQFVERISWTLPGTDNGTLLSEERLIQPSYPDYDTYPAQLIVNPGLACSDTLAFDIRLLPPTYAGFESAYDTCSYSPVRFENTSYTEAGNIIDQYYWDFGNGERSNEQSPRYRYPKAGDYTVQLTTYDTSGCRATSSQLLSYYPLEPDVPLAPSALQACAPGVLTFSTGLDYLTEDYDVNWTFGDGRTSTQLTPTLTYETPGTYTVGVSVVSPFGCRADSTLSYPILIKETPRAGFRYAPQHVTTQNPTVQFDDESQDAISWQWTVDSLYATQQQSFAYTFADSGSLVITQIVTHASGCTDTAEQLLYIEPFVRYYLPSAFTPNGDGDNDQFRSTGVYRYIKDFRLLIYNRWGEEVFTTTDINGSWDGVDQHSGRPVQEGVYLCLVQYSDPTGRQTLKRNILLLR